MISINHAFICMNLYLYIFTDRYDHAPSDDHDDAIIGLASCGHMKLFASASKDATIRIWNIHNKLLRWIFVEYAVYELLDSSRRWQFILVTMNNYITLWSWFKFMQIVSWTIWCSIYFISHLKLIEKDSGITGHICWSLHSQGNCLR